MGDMDRQGVLREVHRNLIRPEFGRRFVAESDDGSKPIVIAMLDDTIAELAGQVYAVGGVANVVTPFMDTLLVYSLHSDAKVHTGPRKVTNKTLDHKCTVGLFIARVAEDASGEGGQTFNFFMGCEDDPVPHSKAHNRPPLLLTCPTNN